MFNTILPLISGILGKKKDSAAGFVNPFFGAVHTVLTKIQDKNPTQPVSQSSTGIVGRVLNAATALTGGGAATTGARVGAGAQRMLSSKTLNAVGRIGGREAVRRRLRTRDKGTGSAIGNGATALTSSYRSFVNKFKSVLGA